MAKRQRLAKVRSYTLRKRATAMDRTRARITLAAIELHGTIGPAATTMSGVADRAGVTRATLYRHFPNEAALLSACSAEWLAAHPRPDPARWSTIPDPADRVAAALDDVYAYYRRTSQMRLNLLRDIAVFPTAVQAGIRSFPANVVDALAAEWPSGPGANLRHAALRLALSFETWRTFKDAGLADAEARDVMVHLVISAAEG